MNDEWAETKLGEVTEQVHEQVALDVGRQYPLLGVRWYAEGPFLREIVDKETSKATKLFRVTAGQFIYNRMFAWKGAFGVVPEDLDGSYVSNEFPLFKCDPSALLPTYLELWFQQPSVWEQVGSVSSGTTASRNRWKEAQFQDYRVPLPPLSVQHRIVNLMAHLDGHITNLLAERDAIHRVWLAMINSSFSNEAWPRAPIGEVVTAGGGRLVDGDWVESKDQAPSGIRLLQLADVARGRFLNKSERFVSPETFQRLRCTDIKEGDLLISRMADPIGRTARVPAALQGSIAAVDVAILTPGLDLDGDYLLGILNSTPWIANCDVRGTGTTRKRISKGNLAKIEIPVPELSVQQRLGANFAGCAASIESLDFEISTMEHLRRRLLTTLLGRHAVIANSYDSLLPEAS